MRAFSNIRMVGVVSLCLVLSLSACGLGGQGQTSVCINSPGCKVTQGQNGGTLPTAMPGTLPTATPMPTKSPIPTATPKKVATTQCVDSSNNAREETGNNKNPVKYPHVVVIKGCVLVVSGYTICVDGKCWGNDPNHRGAVVAFRSGTYDIVLTQGAYALVAIAEAERLFCDTVSKIASLVPNNISPLAEWGSC